MNLLIAREITSVDTLPDFGAAFHAHMAEKKHPQLRMASAFAWSLLAEGLERLGLPLYEVAFNSNGKPYFANRNADFGLSKKENSLQIIDYSLDFAAISSYSGLFFSLSHSGSMAAVLLSDHPCGVDIEQTRREVSDKLYARCMHPAEINSGMDFFEAWTRKECIAKLHGNGLPSFPRDINTLGAGSWFTRSLNDSAGNGYCLSALCADENLSFSI